MAAERYSVRYYNAYKQEELMNVFQKVFDICGNIETPILLNSHSFLDTDIHGEHVTTYEKKPKPNPRFCGETVHTWASRYSKWLLDEYEYSYMWDGDTVEFMTQRFYKTTVEEVVAELTEIESSFVNELQRLPKEGILSEYGPLTLSSRNHPWATYLTNSNNIAMFNNGTFHLNCTLPTRLDIRCRPLWFNDFRTKHQRLARLIQWMEPFWIAVYGSGDPFSSYDSRFAAGSQRLAVSRYVGMGTFDTDKMQRGKFNQIERDLSANPWYRELYEKTAYESFDVIGLDINFNKHWAHGLELRFFDQMPIEHLKTVLIQLVHVMDASLTKSIPNIDARKDVRWKSMAVDALYKGRNWQVQPEQMETICGAFNIECLTKEPVAVEHALEILMKGIQIYSGECCKRMIQSENEQNRSRRYLCKWLNNCFCC
jgi:hypothetical protein